MRLLIAIVNYRTAGLTVDCLASLREEVVSRGDTQVIVVDNASQDGSAARIAEAIRAEDWAWASVLPLQHNGGFAFGNNAAIRAGLKSPQSPEYIFLLNPDTLVRPEALTALVDFLDRHPAVGIAGSRQEDAHGAVQCSAHRIHTPLSELDGAARFGPLSRALQHHAVSPPVQDQSHSCDWVSGAAMMIRRRVLDEIGLMDEEYFLYFEEVDFCTRARAAGWEVWYVPASRIVHLEGASTGVNSERKRRGKYWYDSRRRFFALHYGIVGLMLADALWAVGRMTLFVRRLLGLGGSYRNDPKWFALDLLWGDAKAIGCGSLARRIRRPAHPPLPLRPEGAA